MIVKGFDFGLKEPYTLSPKPSILNPKLWTLDPGP
jgi:hypothetical protein